MKRLVWLLLLLFFVGCKSENHKDTYVAAIDKYIDTINSRAEKDQELYAPPKPVYLKHTVEPARFPRFENSGSSTGATGRTHVTSDIDMSSVIKSQAQRNQTNDERKEAYKKACELYEKLKANYSQNEK